MTNGIQILSRAIEEKADENEWLSVFSKGLQLLDDYDHELLDTTGLTKKQAIYPSREDYQELIDECLSILIHKYSEKKRIKISRVRLLK